MSIPLHMRFSEHPAVDHAVSACMWGFGGPYARYPGVEFYTAEQILRLTIESFGPFAWDVEPLTVH